MGGRGNLILIHTYPSDNFVLNLNDERLAINAFKHDTTRTLVPFSDEGGILRSSSRFNNSALSYTNRNPIILYAKD